MDLTERKCPLKITDPTFFMIRIIYVTLELFILQYIFLLTYKEAS